MPDITIKMIQRGMIQSVFKKKHTIRTHIERKNVAAKKNFSEHCKKAKKRDSYIKIISYYLQFVSLTNKIRTTI